MECNPRSIDRSIGTVSAIGVFLVGKPAWVDSDLGTGIILVYKGHP